MGRRTVQYYNDNAPASSCRRRPRHPAALCRRSRRSSSRWRAAPGRSSC